MHRGQRLFDVRFGAVEESLDPVGGQIVDQVQARGDEHLVGARLRRTQLKHGQDLGQLAPFVEDRLPLRR